MEKPDKAPEITIQQQIDELQRELRIRKSAYTKWVKAGKMKAEVARKQYDSMEAALFTLKFIQDGKKKTQGGQQYEMFKHQKNIL